MVYSHIAYILNPQSSIKRKQDNHCVTSFHNKTHKIPFWFKLEGYSTQKLSLEYQTPTSCETERWLS